MLESGGSVNSPLSARQEAFCFAGREAERSRGPGGGVEKPAGAVGLGGGDDLRGRAGFDHAAGVHEDDLGGGHARIPRRASPRPSEDRGEAEAAALAARVSVRMKLNGA